MLASFEQGLQYALDWFSAACNQVGMEISTKRTELYVSLEILSSVASM